MNRNDVLRSLAHVVGGVLVGTIVLTLLIGPPVAAWGWSRG